jgi:acyl-homoserine lactone acylase PvdQ
VNPAPGRPQPPKPDKFWQDDTTAVVQRADADDEWFRRVEKFRLAHGLGEAGTGADAPKFSHAWVVGGKRTTTGSAVLVSDPRRPFATRRFDGIPRQRQDVDARGIGTGSPGY